MGKPNSFILLVDDDAGKRYTLAKTLIRAGFEVREAETGAEALELLSARPDLVILDVKLPDISGFEVCRRIKSDPADMRHPRAPYFDDIRPSRGQDSGARQRRRRLSDECGRADGADRDSPGPAAGPPGRGNRAAHDAAMANDVRRDQRRGHAARCLGPNRAGEPHSGTYSRAARGAKSSAGSFLPCGISEPWPDDSPFARMLVSGAREAEDLSLGELWLHVSVDPLRSAVGEINGALCIVSDITHRKRMEMQLFRQAEELQKTGQRKDEFLAMLAHELRNPLAPLANTLQIIRMQIKGNQLVEESLDIAGRQIEHITRLLEDLFDVSRTTRGMVELRKKPVDLNTVVNHAVEAALPLIESLKHELSKSLPRESLYVLRRPDSPRADRDQPAEQRSQVHRARRQDRRHAFARRGPGRASRVSDSGIGITPEMQKNIFDLFVQADRSLDRARGGLGIGLTLVRSSRGITRRDDLGFQCRDRPGKHVYREASRVVPEPAPEKCMQSAGPADSENRPLRMLIVDDNRDSARTLARVLEFDGHIVSCVFDGLAVTEVVASFRPDVILLDIGLPGQDGYQVAEQLRRSFPREELTLVAVTGYGEERNHALAKLAGFDHYLIKPLNLEALRTNCWPLGKWRPFDVAAIDERRYSRDAVGHLVESLLA